MRFSSLLLAVFFSPAAISVHAQSPASAPSLFVPLGKNLPAGHPQRGKSFRSIVSRRATSLSSLPELKKLGITTIVDREPSFQAPRNKYVSRPNRLVFVSSAFPLVHSRIRLRRNSRLSFLFFAKLLPRKSLRTAPSATIARAFS